MLSKEEDEIREFTEKYWAHSGDSRRDYDCYVEKLLWRELTFADKSLERLRPLARPVHALAMTVGDSFEPLLQIVCVLKPQRLILILNHDYNGTPGKDHGSQLRRLIKRLPRIPDLPDKFRPQLLPDDEFDCIEIPQDTPTEVFRALTQAFQAPKAQPPADYVNAVDITGAKKSMVVGAFLYAAHSGLPITYVDFEGYHPKFHLPYGHKCKIGQISDPYEAFRLRDWERVRQLYERYDFRSARDLMLSILPVMSGRFGVAEAKRDLYDPADSEKVRQLAQAFEMYGAWENGDYRRADKLCDGLSVRLPPDVKPWAVSALGNDWPSAADIVDVDRAAHRLLDEHLALKRGERQPSDSIFGQPERLLAYIHDEVAKIERLITKNEDFRSAYLRAAGLHEFLLKARLALCWLKGGLEVKPKGAADWYLLSSWTPDAQRHAFEAMVEESSEWKIRKALKSDPPTEYNVPGGNIRRSVMAPTLQAYGIAPPLDLDTVLYPENPTPLDSSQTPVFVKLRGEAIHTHLYIPCQVAEAALHLVLLAVEEFQTNWLEHFHPGVAQATRGQAVECPPWPRLCDIFQLSFLPPKLRD